MAAKLKNKSENSIKAFYGKHRKRLGLDRPAQPDGVKDPAAAPPPAKRAKPPRPTDARATDGKDKLRVDDALQRLMADEVMADASPERELEAGDHMADDGHRPLSRMARERSAGKAIKQAAVKHEQSQEEWIEQDDRRRREEALSDAAARWETLASAGPEPPTNYAQR